MRRYVKYTHYKSLELKTFALINIAISTVQLLTCYFAEANYFLALFMGLYYNNAWGAKNFPFLSQELFTNTSNFTSYEIYNQSLILNDDFTINDNLVDENGIPWLTSSYVVSLITTNAGFTSCFGHQLLWNWHEMKLGWAFINKKTFTRMTTLSTYFFWRHNGRRTEEEKEEMLNNPDIDPHYKVMIRNNYDEAPDSWYFAAFAASFIVAMVSLYVLKSTLPWWGIILAMVILWIWLLFFGAQYALTGFMFNLGTVAQTIAGYVLPGRPLGKLPSAKVIVNFLS